MEKHFAYGRAHITALPLLPPLSNGSLLDKQLESFAADAQHLANQFAYSTPVQAQTSCASGLGGLRSYNIAAWLPMPAGASDYSAYLLAQTGSMQSPAEALAAFAVVLNLIDEQPAELETSYAQTAA